MVVEGERVTYNLTNMYRPSDTSLITFGAEYYEDKGEALTMDAYDKEEWFFWRQPDITFYNSSYFGQYETETPIGNLAVGGRYEHHSFVGGSFVPRFGLTKVWDKFHIKALYSEAFRTPNIENINLNEILLAIIAP